MSLRADRRSNLPFGESVLSRSVTRFIGDCSLAPACQCRCRHYTPRNDIFLLKVPASFLFHLDGFKQGSEVAFAESLGTVSLDDFNEHGGAILIRACKDLQE